METKLWIISIFLFISTIQILLQLVQYRSAKNPIPDNVADVYDNETYLRWQQYHGEHNRLGMLESLVSVAVITLLFVFDVHSFVASWFGDGFFGLVCAVVLFDLVVGTLVSLPFSYIKTMKIEEKYGFNRSTKSTFVKDTVIGFITGTIVTFFIVWAMYLSHKWLGDGMAILLSALLCLFVLFANLLFPLLSRLQNKFTPLEEGSLKNKLTDLLTRHGYEVKGIFVMDASRRTTKSNAYFSGFGKSKRIVLYDTLLETMDEDEICAVFAHELGHGMHHDIPKLLLLNCVQMIFIALLAWAVLSFSEISTAFGFTQTNYGFAYLVLGNVALPLITQLWGIVMCCHTRRAEYAADAQAYKEGYADALISGLKKLNRASFGHLSPSPLVVLLKYTHPPLSRRISALESLKESDKH